MEDRKILIDTSIVIDFLRSKNKSQTQFIKLLIDNTLFISSISIFELYNGATDEYKIQIIDSICKNFEVINFDLDIAKKASELFLQLRSKNKLIEFRDILIGATAIQHALPIATKNKKHFQRLVGVNIFN